MRRILLVLTVALVMAAMMILAAVPAFARINSQPTDPCPAPPPENTSCTAQGGEGNDPGSGTGAGGGGGKLTYNLPDDSNEFSTFSFQGGGGSRDGFRGGGSCEGVSSTPVCVGSPGVRT